MMTRGVRFARGESRPVRLLRDGSLEVQPGQTAARLHRARGRFVASGIVLFPLLSGLFFGVISGLAVLPRVGIEHAIVMGALVGGIMFTSNAVALCIVQASASASANADAAPRARQAARGVGEAKAS